MNRAGLIVSKIAMLHTKHTKSTHKGKVRYKLGKKIRWIFRCIYCHYLGKGGSVRVRGRSIDPEYDYG